MSAGFDACNLTPVRFVGNSQVVGTSEAIASTRDVDPAAVSASDMLPCPCVEVRDLSTAATHDSSCRVEQTDAPEGRALDPVTAKRMATVNLHRIAEARKQQGISLRTVSRRTGLDIKTLRSQEEPCADLTLSQVNVWQAALDVPLVDLIEDHQDALSRPVKERACMVRIMKTAVALKEVGGSARCQRLAEMLIQQLLELMPELEQIGGWPQHGGRRTGSLSRIIEQQVDTRSLGHGE